VARVAHHREPGHQQVTGTRREGRQAMAASGTGRTWQPGEDVFLGALLGAAIGDALGMPGGNGGRTDPGAPLTGYEALRRPGGEVEAGEFTDESESILSIVEVATTDRGRLDPDLIGPRLVRLAQGESAAWLDDATRAALLRAADTFDFAVPLDEDGPVSAAVATRGVPVGLLHAVGELDDAAMRADADTVTRLTHGSPAQASAVLAVAHVVRLAARREGDPADWPSVAAARLVGGEMQRVLRDIPAGGAAEVVPGLAAGSPERQVLAGVVAATGTDTFPDAVLLAAGSGGKADAIATIAGAVAGARHGVAGIPQWLIDGLGGRIYVSLAAPWFRRAAMYRAGLIRDLPNGGTAPPRPIFPPRQ
jgi:ADP-ribosylglycohydrolase